MLKKSIPFTGILVSAFCVIIYSEQVFDTLQVDSQICGCVGVTVDSLKLKQFTRTFRNDTIAISGTGFTNHTELIALVQRKGDSIVGQIEGKGQPYTCMFECPFVLYLPNCVNDFYSMDFRVNYFLTIGASITRETEPHIQRPQSKPLSLQERVELYPSTLILDFHDHMDPVTVSIFDLSGKKLYEAQNKPMVKMIIPTAFLNSGVFVLALVQNRSREVFKFTVVN